MPELMYHPLQIDRPITFFDLETTSANVDEARIIEIAMIRIESDESHETWSARLNPGIPIEPGATEVHGITSEDIRDAPAFRDVARRVCELLQGADLAGFNATGFDVPILDAELKRAGLRGGLDDPRICPPDRSIVDAYDLECALNVRTLEALYERYTGTKLEGSHAAEQDLLATISVLDAQLMQHGIRNPTPSELAKLARGDYLDSKRRLKLRDDGEIVVCFGKHSGMTLSEMFTKEPGYVDWMCRKLDAEIVGIIKDHRAALANV